MLGDVIKFSIFTAIVDLFAKSGVNIKDVGGYWYVGLVPFISLIIEFLFVNIELFILFIVFEKQNYKESDRDTIEGIIFHLIMKDMKIFLMPFNYGLIRAIVYTLRCKHNEVRESVTTTIISILTY